MRKVLASFICFGFIFIFAAILVSIGIEADSLGVFGQLLIGAFVVYTIPVIWKKIMKNEKPKKIDKQEVKCFSENDEYFGIAQAELDNQTYDKNLWTKAFVQYPENENLQKSEYIKLRVENLEKEYKQEQEALEKEYKQEQEDLEKAEAERIKAMTWKERWKEAPFYTKAVIIFGIAIISIFLFYILTIIISGIFFPLKIVTDY